MNAQEPARLVQNTGAIRTLIDAIQGERCIALDTEFHAERRYHPELMLVQLAVQSGETWVIDPLAVSLSALSAVLTEKEVLVHSGSQDLAILERDIGATPTHAFDVQLAAGMVGLGHPTRLDTIVSTVLQAKMDKGSTLSNWAQRPLSPVQISYAAADVRVLFPLRAALETMLQERERLEWAVEESHAMAERAVSQAEVNQTWSRWDIAPRLDSDTHKVMTVLFHWRDQQGRNKNQPAHFILSDGLCLDIARRKPRSLATLAENRRIPQGLLKRLGKEIVGAVEWALDNEVTLPFIPSANEQQRAKALKLWTEARGAELGIAAGLLMSEQLALEVARSGTAAISGWRSEAIGESLEQFLSGQTSIFMAEDGATIR